MGMGRPKLHDKHLPQRMRKKGNAYYHVGLRWTPLGSDLAIAKLRWAELEGVNNHKTFNAALDKFLASKDFAKLAANTQRSYRAQETILRKTFGQMNCASITPAHIYQFLDKHPSPSAANVGVNVMSKSLEIARKLGWVRDNPCVNTPRNATEGRRRYLNDSEYQTINQHASEALRAIMRVTYLTGQRMVDIIKMRLSDITDEGILVVQQKTGKKQLFLWTDELREAIAEAKALERPIRGMTLFCTRTGRPYNDSNLRKQWATACEKAGVENAQFRDLRSKAATDAAELNQDYQAILGHTSKAMSDKYVKQFATQKVTPLRKKI